MLPEQGKDSNTSFDSNIRLQLCCCYQEGTPRKDASHHLLLLDTSDPYVSLEASQLSFSAALDLQLMWIAVYEASLLLL